MSSRINIANAATSTTSSSVATASSKLATTSSTQPKSILKKPVTPTTPPIAISSISFFSGNESNLVKQKPTFVTTTNGNPSGSSGGAEDDVVLEDEVNSGMYSMEKRYTMHPHKDTAAKAARVKLHQLELHHRINGEDEDNDDTDENREESPDKDGHQVNKRSLTTGKYLKKSSLTAPWNGPGQNHVRRKPSSAYILHSKQIDAEVGFILYFFW